MPPRYSSFRRFGNLIPVVYSAKPCFRRRNESNNFEKCCICWFIALAAFDVSTAARLHYDLIVTWCVKSVCNLNSSSSSTVAMDNNVLGSVVASIFHCILFSSALCWQKIVCRSVLYYRAVTVTQLLFLAALPFTVISPSRMLITVSPKKFYN